MDDRILIPVAFAGDHHTEFALSLEKDDRHHQRAGKIEGVVLSEGEIVRH